MAPKKSKKVHGASSRDLQRYGLTQQEIDARRGLVEQNSANNWTQDCDNAETDERRKILREQALIHESMEKWALWGYRLHACLPALENFRNGVLQTAQSEKKSLQDLAMAVTADDGKSFDVDFAVYTSWTRCKLDEPCLPKSRAISPQAVHRCAWKDAVKIMTPEANARDVIRSDEHKDFEGLVQKEQDGRAQAISLCALHALATSELRLRSRLAEEHEQIFPQVQFFAAKFCEFVYSALSPDLTEAPPSELVGSASILRAVMPGSDIDIAVRFSPSRQQCEVLRNQFSSWISANNDFDIRQVEWVNPLRGRRLMRCKLSGLPIDVTFSTNIEPQNPPLNVEKFITFLVPIRSICRRNPYFSAIKGATISAWVNDFYTHDNSVGLRGELRKGSFLFLCRFFSWLASSRFKDREGLWWKDPLERIVAAQPIWDKESPADMHESLLRFYRDGTGKFTPQSLAAALAPPWLHLSCVFVPLTTKVFDMELHGDLQRRFQRDHYCSFGVHDSDKVDNDQRSRTARFCSRKDLPPFTAISEKRETEMRKSHGLLPCFFVGDDLLSVHPYCSSKNFKIDHERHSTKRILLEATLPGPADFATSIFNDLARLLELNAVQVAHALIFAQQ